MLLYPYYIKITNIHIEAITDNFTVNGPNFLYESNVLIMLPLENYGNMLRVGMNTISVVVENESEDKVLSDKFDFNYEAAATAE